MKPGIRIITISPIVSFNTYNHKIMKSCLLSPRLIKIKKDKTNKSSQILEDLSKYDTSEYLSPSTTRRKKSKRRFNKSSHLYEDSSIFFKTSPVSFRKKLSPGRVQKQETLKDPEEKLKKLVIKDKLKKTNEKIRRKNAIYRKLLDLHHPLPWGADQRVKQKKKSSDPDLVKIRVKTDRYPSRRAQRKEIGLDMYPNIKVKSKKSNKSEEKPKMKRSPDPIVLNYIKQKKKNERLLKLKAKIEENIREKERIKALTLLEKTQLRKIKRKKKKKKLSSLDEDKVTDPAASVGFGKYQNGANKSNLSLNNNIREKNSKRLKEKWKFALPIAEIVKIQRWFRKNRSKFRSSKDSYANNTSSSNLSKTIKGFNLGNHFADRCSDNSTVPAYMSTDYKTLPDVEESPKIKKVQKVTQTSLCQIIKAKENSFEIDQDSFNEDLNKAAFQKTTDIDELYERFQNFNIDSLESFSSQAQQISQLDFEIGESFPLSHRVVDEVKAQGEIKDDKIEEIKEIPKFDIKIQKNDEIDGSSHSRTSSNSNTSNNYSNSSSTYQEAENSLKQIFENQGKIPNMIAQPQERPGINMKDGSDSSEEEWNSNIVIYADTNISEQTLETLEYKQRYFLTDYDPEIRSLINFEIEEFLTLVKFQNRVKEVDETWKFIQSIITKVFDSIETQTFLASINSPCESNAPKKLKILQTVPVGDMIKEIKIKELIPYETRDQVLKGLNEVQSIYVFMVMDALNEALNCQLPFYPGGLPLPWSQKSSLFILNTNLAQINLLARNMMQKWESVHAGINPVISDNDLVEKAREERMNILLSSLIHEQEPEWLNYEDEESQLKIDISDLVFEYIIEETSSLILSHK